MTTIEITDDDIKCSEHRSWPEFPITVTNLGNGRDPIIMRVMAEEAMLILMASGIIIPLSAGEKEERTIGLFVNCNDTFYYACADAEPIPPVGFGYESEQPFWKLYDLCREFGSSGAVIWASERRGMLPIQRLCKRMKESGEWPKEMIDLELKNKP